MEHAHLAGRKIDLGQVHVFFRIDAGTHDAAPRSPAGLALEVRGHGNALVLEGNVQRVVFGAIGDRPESAGVVVAAENFVAVFFEQLVRIDPGLAGLQVDVVHVDVGVVVRERVCPQELAGFLVDHEHAAALADRHDQVAFLVARYRVSNPFDVLGIGIDTRAHQDALLIVVRVPVVAGQLLVVPRELSGADIERNR